MKMKAKRLILSRLLPKTGQTDPSDPFEDGYYQAGWWKGLTVDNNKTRFISKTIDGDDVVIDNATDLMWAADGNEAGCLGGVKGSVPVLYAWIMGLDFAGFTDWRIPNIFELYSIVDFSLNNPSIEEPPFANTESLGYRSSTTDSTNLLNGYAVMFSNSVTLSLIKTLELYVRAVRGGV